MNGKNGYHRILLVSDGTESSGAAEQTAFNLAKLHQSSVTIVDTIRPRSPVSKWLTGKYDDSFDEFVTEKQERLEKVAIRFTDAGIKVDAEVLFGNSTECIVSKVLAEQADLVVRYKKGAKSQQSHSRYGTTAVNLMRVCPCPLLLVGDEPVSDPKVLACVDARHPFAENQGILTSAKTMAGNDEKLRAVYCWAYSDYAHLKEHYADKIHPELPDGQTELNLFREEERQYYQGIYDRFVQHQNLSHFPGGLHLENGEPTKVIPEICRQETIEVVVMSNATLNHPLRRLLGSTVESVIEQLPCALLIVKPAGFKSPVQPIPAKTYTARTSEAARIKKKVTSPKAYITVFDDLNTAKHAVQNLLDAGFSLEKIELITRNVHGQVPDIETPRDHETTGSSMIESAARWGGAGTAAGALSIAFAPFPGLVLGMMAVGGLTAAIMGAVVGIEHAVDDDSVNLPTLEEYEQLVSHGNCLVVVRGTHAEVKQAKSVINEMSEARSHIFTLHGHDSHEHPVRT